MSDNLTAAELAELQAAIEALTPTERCILEKLTEQHDIEDVFEIISAMAEADDETAAEYRFPDLDPYAKAEPLLGDRRHNFWFGEDSRIRVTNLSAFWLPELALKKEIGGTLYIVESVSAEKAVPVIENKLKRLILQGVKISKNSKVS